MRTRTPLILYVLLCSAPIAAAATPYSPSAARWETRTPAQVGMDATLIDEAIAHAKANESKESRDLEQAHYASPFGREPFNDVVGPMKPRGDQTGIIIRNGYIIAEWGEPARVDLTFSVAKSFLSTVVGLAADRGMIDISDPVAKSVGPIIDRDGKVLDLFASDHSKTITWDHLLRQTSDWKGTLWAKPDWADRPAQDLNAEMARDRHAPGTVYEYNDTRVNLLALAILNVWRRPLPQVLNEMVMEPIGASRTWRWTGYNNSWILLDGQLVQSVSGGSHWGGGMFISARDQARFGLLTLRNGRWGDRQILSEAWLRAARTPTPAKSDYGFMNYFLNNDRKLLPSAPATAFVHIGAGQNAIYVDQENDLVIVLRWIQGSAVDGVVKRVIQGIR